jgi:mutator protein MutT
VKTVVAAIIEFDRRVLICQRRAGDHYAFKWEFPGGKVKPGETLQAALKRELREELDADCPIGAEIYRVRFRYPEMRDEIELVFYAATAHPDSVCNMVFQQMRWAEYSELLNVDFLPADHDLVAKLASGVLRPTPRDVAAGTPGEKHR